MAPENDPPWTQWTSAEAIVRAALYAERAHRDITRRYTGEPYIVHPGEVARMTASDPQLPEPTPAIQAAWLHDVVEDTGVEIEMIEWHFGPEVARIVWGLTDQCHEGNRAARKAAECARLADEPGDVQTVKCYDIISNTPSIVAHDPSFAAVYIREVEALRRALTKATANARMTLALSQTLSFSQLGLERD